MQKKLGQKIYGEYSTVYQKSLSINLIATLGKQQINWESTIQDFFLFVRWFKQYWSDMPVCLKLNNLFDEIFNTKSAAYLCVFFIFRVDSVKPQALQYVKEVREGCMYTLHKDDCVCRPSFVCDAVSSDRK